MLKRFQLTNPFLQNHNTIFSKLQLYINSREKSSLFNTKRNLRV